jgi:hypothetical protein
MIRRLEDRLGYGSRGFVHVAGLRIPHICGAGMTRRPGNGTLAAIHAQTNLPSRRRQCRRHPAL